MKEVKQLEDTSKGKSKKTYSRKRSSQDTRTVTVPFPWLYASIVLFLTVPLFIFFLGYLRLSVGIPLTLLFAGIVLYCVSDCLNDPNGTKLSKSGNDLKIPLSYLIGYAITALAISYISGVGEYVFTIQDHPYRRAILRDLINYDWPVIYNYSTQTNPEVREIFGIASGERAFSYYFIYWLPAALAGKVFGFEAGNFILLLWNSLGIFLSLTSVSVFIKKFSAWVPFMYIFFAGLDIIPDAVYFLKPYESWYWVEGWIPKLSYVSNFRELACVYNQMVPCFLIIVLLFLSHNTRSMGLTAGILFCYSPWAVFGIIPIIGAILFGKKHRANSTSKTVKNVLSPVNIVSSLLILIIFGSYYMANSGAVEYRGFTWNFLDQPIMFIPYYLIFIALKVAPFAIVLYKRNKANPVYWTSVITLLVIPFYVVTGMNDFCMRGSMPALFFFCIDFCALVIETMDEKNTPKTRIGWLKSAAVMLLVILMMFPALFNLFIIFGSFFMKWPNNKEDIGSFGNINHAEYATTIQTQFFVKDFETSFFYKYFAK